ncbi:MAG: hypothetical protein AAGA33_05965 [Pseudomonadota bacterium]
MSKEILVDRLNELSASDRPDQVADFLPLIRDAEAFADQQRDPEAYHLAALVWYDYPDDTKERSDKVKSFLTRALSIDPDHMFARQYIAYTCFDEGDYEAALSHLRRLNTDYFENLDQHWRVLKNRELEIAADLYLGNAVSQSAFANLVFDYVSAESDDYAPIPLELAQCLANLHSAGRSDRLIVGQFTQLVDRLSCRHALVSEMAVLERNMP